MRVKALPHERHVIEKQTMLPFEVLVHSSNCTQQSAPKYQASVVTSGYWGMTDLIILVDRLLPVGQLFFSWKSL